MTAKQKPDTPPTPAADPAANTSEVGSVDTNASGQHGTSVAQPEAPTDPAPLRTDGPTLKQYVAAGYLAENYPPEGYAAVPPADDDDGPDTELSRLVPRYSSTLLKLIYDLEHRAAKGHGLDSDRALMLEAATALRQELGVEGVPLLPDGSFKSIDNLPDSTQNPT